MSTTKMSTKVGRVYVDWPSRAKWNRAMAVYEGPTCPSILAAILDRIGQKLGDELTGRQLGQVMTIEYGAFEAGRASNGGISIEHEDGAVWLPDSVVPGGRLIGIDELRAATEAVPR